MLNKNRFFHLIVMGFWIGSTSPCSYAIPEDGLGQTIQIQTNFHSLRGRGTLTLILRDLDRQETVPYVFDIVQPNNLWFIFTRSRHYLITASQLQWSQYQPCCNQYKNMMTRNFCHLESGGRIMRSRSLRVQITGDLSPYPYTYSCQIITFPGNDLGIAKKPPCPCPPPKPTQKILSNVSST